MADCQDLINETQRLLMPLNRDVVLSLSSNYTAGGTTISFTDTSVNANNTKMILPGVVISVDLELMLVTSAPSGGSFGVQPGYLGSTQANHSSGVLIYVNRRFTDFECFQQINHVLDDLGSMGLYNLAELEVTFNPVIQAYDLTDVNTSTAISNYIDGIAVRYKTPLPDRKYGTIPSNKWEVLPFASTTVESYFPSGYSLILNDVAWPGLPILFLFKQGFSHFTGYTDSATTIAHLGSTMFDIPPMGAMLRMVQPREVERNQFVAQPDSRFAPEVPPGAVAASTNAVAASYMQRIANEKERLKRAERHFRSRR